jgi:hypothetical protein
MKIMSRLVAESGKLAAPFRGRLWLFNRVSGCFLEGSFADARARSLFRIKGPVAKSRPPGTP